MEIVKADEILEKYGLKQAASDEFKVKTRHDTGKMNVGLRLRICADHLDRKSRELRDKRSKILKELNHACPNYEIAKERNRFAHEDCEFNCMVPADFCLNCDFYKANIKKYDDAFPKLREAAETYRKVADYDDVWQ